MTQTTANLFYLVTIVCFILALKFLSSPTTARRGNWIGAFGMAVAIVVTAALHDVQVGWKMIVGGAIGGVFGLVGARRVKMTAMPQMVALFNGVGGGAAALVSIAEFHRLTGHINLIVHGCFGAVGSPLCGAPVQRDVSLAIVLSAAIGSISFAGSMVAYAKLQELIGGRPITYPGQQFVNLALFGGIVALGAWVVSGNRDEWPLWLMVGASLLFGVLFVLPIGGADMPVVISLLNAFTGLAAAATGFELHSYVLIVSGALVGASGTLLTMMMGRAMNRSIGNVLFGAFGKVQAGAGVAAVEGTVRSVNAEDVAIMLSYAQNVVIVPGYGMAVAQAQHAVRELAEELERKGVHVSYAIHPVAGRMPGHMNVLLAEANVPYDALKEMDEINPEFPQTDVSLVIGANDVVNPAARNEPGSPIYGMPILNVDASKQVIVMKRSMATGFAGIDNPLFVEPQTAMLFGDAKQSVLDLVAAVKAL